MTTLDLNKVVVVTYYSLQDFGEDERYENEQELDMSLDCAISELEKQNGRLQDFGFDIKTIQAVTINGVEKTIEFEARKEQNSATDYIQYKICL